jgi:hypothetical protein
LSLQEQTYIDGLSLVRVWAMLWQSTRSTRLKRLHTEKPHLSASSPNSPPHTVVFTLLTTVITTAHTTVHIAPLPPLSHTSPCPTYTPSTLILRLPFKNCETTERRRKRKIDSLVLCVRWTWARMTMRRRRRRARRL